MQGRTNIRAPRCLGDVMRAKSFSALIALSVVGCSSPAEPNNHADLLENRVGVLDSNDARLATIAAKPGRRLVVANLQSGNFCAEPPAEAADSITQALADVIADGMRGKAPLDADAVATYTGNVTHLYRQAHTVQIFRDAAFYLCLDAVNNAITANNAHAAPIAAYEELQAYASYSEYIRDIIADLKQPLIEEIRLFYLAKAQVEQTDVPALMGGNFDGAVMVTGPDLPIQSNQTRVATDELPVEDSRLAANDLEAEETQQQQTSDGNARGSKPATGNGRRPVRITGGY